ncbi:MAG: hypothetical protein C5B57_04275 [Blastocatellia bacterium]|nr:MAG: hypothetical protein C5B57_04275 [Blastocatellia bacterium]
MLACSPQGIADAPPPTAARPAPAAAPAPAPAPVPRAAAPGATRWMMPTAKCSLPMSTTRIVRSTPGVAFTAFTSSSVM